VTVYESPPAEIRRSTRRWTIDIDLVEFPRVSQLNVMTIRWKVDGISSGRLTFVVRASTSGFLGFDVNCVETGDNVDIFDYHRCSECAELQGRI